VWTVGDSVPPVLGSGFCVIDAGTVVTARHVLPEEERSVGGQVNVGLPIPDMRGTPTGFSRNQFLSWGATCVAESEEDDLALLHLHAPLPITAVLDGVEEDARLKPIALSERRVRDGDAVAVSGHPFGHAAMVTTTGVVASAWSSVPNTWQAPGARHLIDVTANQGSSGGPCYSTVNGDLVGVLVSGRMSASPSGDGRYFSGLSVVVPGQRIQALIAESGL
jgi:hypothetical protein